MFPRMASLTVFPFAAAARRNIPASKVDVGRAITLQNDQGCIPQLARCWPDLRRRATLVLLNRMTKLGNCWLLHLTTKPPFCRAARASCEVACGVFAVKLHGRHLSTRLDAFAAPHALLSSGCSWMHSIVLAALKLNFALTCFVHPAQASFLAKPKRKLCRFLPLLWKVPLPDPWLGPEGARLRSAAYPCGEVCANVTQASFLKARALAVGPLQPSAFVSCTCFPWCPWSTSTGNLCVFLMAELRPKGPTWYSHLLQPLLQVIGLKGHTLQMPAYVRTHGFALTAS